MVRGMTRFICAALLAASMPVFATSFTVNSPADPGDGVCDATCTLRDAILAANGTAGSDAIAFAGPFTIAVTSPLPEITDALTISGTVTLDGQNAQPVGILVRTGSCVISGLSITRFTGDAIVLYSGGNSVAGCTLTGNGGGIAVYGTTGNHITANVISGNGTAGNAVDLLPLFGPPQLPPATPDSNVVNANLIGVAADGVTPLGNGRDGVAINAGSTNQVLDNVIAYNAGNAITITEYVSVNPFAVYTAYDNVITGNRIGGNAGIAVDLSRDGVTPNDPLDADGGPNKLQNFPVLTSASSTSVSGTLDSTPASTFTIQIFDAALPATLVTSFNVTTDANGHAAFTQAISPGTAVALVATATGSATSEYSAPIAVASAASVPVLSPTILMLLAVVLVTIAFARVS